MQTYYMHRCIAYNTYSIIMQPLLTHSDPDRGSSCSGWSWTAPGISSELASLAGDGDGEDRTAASVPSLCVSLWNTTYSHF